MLPTATRTRASVLRLLCRQVGSAPSASLRGGRWIVPPPAGATAWICLLDGRRGSCATRARR